MKAHGNAVALAVMVTVTAAHAAAFPTYSTDEYCKASTAVAGPPHEKTAFEACFKYEELQRNRLAKAWNRVGPDIQDKCIKRGQAAKGGSYAMLLGCVITEVADRWISNGGFYDGR